MKTLFDTDVRYARSSTVLWKLEDGKCSYRYPWSSWFEHEGVSPYRFNYWILAGITREVPSEDAV
jgi:LPS sulfotransferase NodH